MYKYSTSEKNTFTSDRAILSICVCNLNLTTYLRLNWVADWICSCSKNPKNSLSGIVKELYIWQIQFSFIYFFRSLSILTSKLRRAYTYWSLSQYEILNDNFRWKSCGVSKNHKSKTDGLAHSNLIHIRWASYKCSRFYELIDPFLILVISKCIYRKIEIVIKII